MLKIPKTSYILGLASIGIVTFLLLTHSKQKEPKSEEAKPPAGTFQATDAIWESLKFAPTQQKAFHTSIKTEGKIAANDDTTTPVYSPYSGRVTKLFAKAGSHIERGDPLMAIASADFINARAQLKLATENEKRQHALYDAKTGAQKDWLQAQADLETAKGNFRAAGLEQDALRERLETLGKSNEEIASLGTDAIITAPISGTIIQRQVGLGQYINSASGGASTPTFSIGNLSTVWLLANVREADIPKMHAGASIEVEVPAYPGRVFKSKLAYIAPAIDTGTHRLPVRAEIDNADGALKPEMFASFRITADNDSPAVAIPEDAIIYEGSDAHVWVAQPERKLISLRPVRIGRNDNGLIEVTQGLKNNETVVTSGSLFIDRAAKADNQETAGNDSPVAQKQEPDKAQ